jgi:phosphoglycolate phosphatase
MKLILFDCDGTLIDSQYLIVASMNMAFESVNLPAPTREKTLSIVGLSLPEAFDILTTSHHAELITQFKASYNLLRHNKNPEPLYAGAKEALLALNARADVQLGVATGKSQRGVDLLIKDHGLEGIFITHQTADNALSKPNPAMIMQARAQTGLQDVIMIGDTSYDMLMAKNAKAFAIGVTWGYHTQDELVAAGADVIVHDYAELMVFLLQHI